MNKPIPIKLSNNTKIIAHRGLSGLAPENTLEAFTLAGEYGYYGTECDIHFSKDRNIIVFHDFTLERMTGKNLLIKDLTIDEINKVKINAGNGINNYGNVRIPLLAEYLDICLKYNMVPVIEIKSVIDIRDLDLLVDLLKSKSLLYKAHVISFYLEFLIYLRNAYQDIILYYLVDEIKEEDILICKTYYMNIDANCKKLTTKDIINCHNHHLKVNTYTVDDLELAHTFNKVNIDYITSNILKESV